MTDAVSAVPAQAAAEADDPLIETKYQGWSFADPDARIMRWWRDQVAANELHPLHAEAKVMVAALDALLARVAEAERERDWQMGQKLEAQQALAAITESLDLRLADLGNGWTEGALKILARIEEIVDQAATDHSRAERAEAEAKRLRADEARTREVLGMAERQVNDLRRALEWIVSDYGSVDEGVLKVARAALAGGDDAA